MRLVMESCNICLLLLQNIIPLGSLPVEMQEIAIIEDLLFCMEVGVVSAIAMKACFISPLFN